MLRRMFFKGAAAAVAGVVGGSWLLGRGNRCRRCGGFHLAKCDYRPPKPFVEQQLDYTPEELAEIIRRSPDMEKWVLVRDPVYCPECRERRLRRSGLYTDRGPARPGGLRERIGALMQEES